MKIWIDISNSPQVHFFKNVIKRLGKLGHEMVITSRAFGNMEGMVSRHDFPCQFIGEHGGSSKDMKLICSSKRILGLTDLVNREKPDVALFKHSVEAPRVAYGLGIPSICVLDNENAIAQNKLMLPISSKIIAPNAIKSDYIRKFGVNEDQIRLFDGFCELAHIEDFIPNCEVLNELRLDEDLPIIILRPEPIMANYYHGDHDASIVLNLLERFHNAQCVVFPRNEVQRRLLEKNGAIIPKHCIDALSLMHYSDVVISAGGSMNREAVAMGKPAISTYPEKLLAITRHMVDSGIKMHSCEASAVKSFADDLMGNKAYERWVKDKLRAMENPIDVILEELDKL